MLRPLAESVRLKRHAQVEGAYSPDSLSGAVCLIGTPGSAQRLKNENKLRTCDLKHVVIDEAD